MLRQEIRRADGSSVLDLILMRRHRSVASLAFHGFVCGLALVAVLAATRPAAAQVQPILSLNNGITNALVYQPLSFGRGQITFHFFIATSNADSLDTTLSATLPPGVSFVSTTNGTASLSGSPSTGQQVTISLGTLSQFAPLLGYAFTAAIDQSQPDGTQLQASFQATGHASSSTVLQSSNTITFSLHPGYLPVGVFITNFQADCQAIAGSVNLMDQSQSRAATATAQQSGASAIATTDAPSALPVNNGGVPAPVQIGVIAGPASQVRIDGVGLEATAQGGASYVVDLSSGTISGTAVPGRSSCDEKVFVGFQNPNSYPVALILDQRFSTFSAAGDEAATNAGSGQRFGYPGNADFGSSSNLNFDFSGEGIKTNSIVKRILYAPGSNTLRTQQTISCFAEAQSTCDSNPPTDSTQNIGGLVPFGVATGGLLVGSLTTPSSDPSRSFEANAVTDSPNVTAFGGTNFVFDPNTGSVSIVRSGYGLISMKTTSILMRGDANVGTLEAGVPVRMEITGHSPIELLVTDSQGRRAGFQAAPAAPAPPPTIDSEPAILAEIFGASYSTNASQPRMVTIPDPQAANYQILAFGTGSGPFTVTVQTFDVNDQSIDQLSQNGTAAPGSSSTFNVSVDPSGHLSIPGAPQPDTTPPNTLAAVSPKPNAAGWNNSDVTVTLTANDNAGGSGVKQVAYLLSGATTLPLTTVNGPTATIAIGQEGVTTIEFFATDNAGNMEAPRSLTILLDKTPPVIQASRTPGANQFGWNNTNVTVSFACSDSLSGLASGSPPPTTIVSAEVASQSVTGTCYDIAGNSSTAAVASINIDKTPPTVTCSSSPNVLWPPNNQLVNIATSVTVTDSLSGPAGFELLSVVSNEPDTGLGDIVGWTVGTAATTGQLRAARLGNGNGRVYTLAYQGQDKAGNSSDCLTTVSVPHDQGQP